MKRKDFLIILIPAFIVTVLWVIFTIYHSLTTSTITDPLTVQIIPISGTFDQKAIENIKNRARIEPLYDLQAIPQISPTPSLSVSLSPTPKASPSAIPTGIETPVPTEQITP